MRKIIRWSAVVLGVVVLAVALSVVADGWRLYRSAVEAVPVEQAVDQVRAQDHYTALEQMPALYPQAVVAVEDRRFYDHGGVDPIAIGRAVWVNLRTGSLAEGGSTLTQQLAKNLYFTQEKKFSRKVAEVFVAWELERRYDKGEILELYINTIYYGEGYYGIYQASQGYFGKAPADMTDYECTLLAGVPNAPSVYAPTVNPDLAAQRQRQVVDSLVDAGYIAAGRAEEILQGGEAA